MINKTLKDSHLGQKFTFADAREFIQIADNNQDHKISHQELFKVFKKILIDEDS
jgi:hypothetical protein